MNGARAGHLAELLGAAGLDDVRDTVITAHADYDDFEDWWLPFSLGVGPAGAYLMSLDQEHRDRLRDTCRDLLGGPPFSVSGHAWAARGTRPAP
jgi:hypothetical protein